MTPGDTAFKLCPLIRCVTAGPNRHMLPALGNLMSRGEHVTFRSRYAVDEVDVVRRRRSKVVAVSPRQRP